MQIEPCGHRVLVKPFDVAEVDEQIKRAKSFGLDMSAVTNNKREQEAVVVGTVLKIGNTAWKDPSLGGEPWAQVGDKVYFAKFAGKQIKLPGSEEDLLVLNDEDIVAVIKED